MFIIAIIGFIYSFVWDTLCEIGPPILKTKKNNAEQKENQICMMKLSNIWL